MKEQRASEIAFALNDVERWHTHSRGISMEVLRMELKLQIEDFGAKAELAAKLKLYFKLLQDYMMRRGQEDVLHMPGTYTHIWEG